MGREDHEDSHADGKKPIWKQTAFEFPEPGRNGSCNTITAFCGSCLDTGWIWERCPTVYCGEPSCKKDRKHKYAAQCPCSAENPVIRIRRAGLAGATA